jgi:hypothetical protein
MIVGTRWLADMQEDLAAKITTALSKESGIELAKML